MAREIKFRGFNRKNNVWLYGFYLQNRGAHFVCPDEFATGKSWDDYEIDPDTRGEFTGRKDKNGKEIYEGDVVRKKSNTYPNVGVVKYCDNGCQFVVESEYAAFDLTECYATGEHLSEYVYNEYEVIGNIHDNPELLK